VIHMILLERNRMLSARIVLRVRDTRDARIINSAS